jgi:hypothetical protein
MITIVGVKIKLQLYSKIYSVFGEQEELKTKVRYSKEETGMVADIYQKKIIKKLSLQQNIGNVTLVYLICKQNAFELIYVSQKTTILTEINHYIRSSHGCFVFFTLSPSNSGWHYTRSIIL